MAFRSGLEKNNALMLRKAGERFAYEPFKIRYTQPAKSRLYLPDFVFPNGIIVEAKGKWETEDRTKFKYILDCWPDLDLRFVFYNANAKIRKGSKTTHGEYATKQGWLWSNRILPLEWVREAPNTASQRAINEILKDPINRK